jgi:hypothetical protein
LGWVAFFFTRLHSTCDMLRLVYLTSQSHLEQPASGQECLSLMVDAVAPYPSAGRSA